MLPRRRTCDGASHEKLHDIISHRLGVVVLRAGAAERMLEKVPARAREVLASIRSTGLESIGEMKTLLGLLDELPISSREPEPSLLHLERLLVQVADAGHPVELTIEGARRELPAAVEGTAWQ